MRRWSRRTSNPVKSHRGARFASALCGTTDDVLEARPRRRTRNARRSHTAGAETDETEQDGNSLPSLSDDRGSWATAHSEQDTYSEVSDSISSAKTPPISDSQIDQQGGTQSLEECTICTDLLPQSRFPERAPTTTCTHSPTTCRRCLRRWIDSSFLTRVWNHIDCPQCDQRLQRADVRAFADPKLVAKYEELADKAAMEGIPGFRWCIANRCGSGQVHEGEGLSKFVCVNCAAEQCVVHDVPWHKKETCAEYEYRYGVIRCWACL
jgi:hypothetical protein